jgi:hypothetical protein
MLLVEMVKIQEVGKAPYQESFIVPKCYRSRKGSIHAAGCNG